jgi:hypothetical protein
MIKLATHGATVLFAVAFRSPDSLCHRSPILDRLRLGVAAFSQRIYAPWEVFPPQRNTKKCKQSRSFQDRPYCKRDT